MPRVLAVLGVLVLAAALFLGVRLARLADEVRAGDETALSAPSGGGCVNHVETLVRLDRRVLALGESTTLEVELRNRGRTNCSVEVLLQAARFDVSPPEASVRLHIPGDNRRLASWVVAPTAAGDQALVVRAGLAMERLHVRVTDVLGLTPAQAQLLSWVGRFFGPALTLPWIFDRWRERQQRRRERERPPTPVA